VLLQGRANCVTRGFLDTKVGLHRKVTSALRPRWSLDPIRRGRTFPGAQFRIHVISAICLDVRAGRVPQNNR
jgi:hypothetical protein